MSSLLGTRFGTIRVTDRLGEGGMGSLWVGFDERLQREVALKGIRRDRMSAEAHARFLREARILSQLEHPSICTIHGYLEGEDDDFIVLELVRGQNLREAIAADALPNDLMRLARQMAEALSYAHARGIIHRDLKPENVMLDESGNVKVLDFGIARVEDEIDETTQIEGLASAAETLDKTTDSETLETLENTSDPTTTSWTSRQSSHVETRYGTLLGTLRYMSPEHARAEPTVPVSDVYSLGLILQELFTGKPAYPLGISPTVLLMKVGRAETEAIEGIDRDVGRLFESMLGLEPEQRPSAREVLERLSWIVDRPRRRTRRVLAAALIVGVLGASAKYTVDLQRERNAAVAAREGEARSRQEAEEVTDLMIDLFELSDPRSGRGETITAREILERGTERVRRDLVDQPQIQGRMLTTIGSVLCHLGLFERAESVLREAVAIGRKGGTERPVGQSSGPPSPLAIALADSLDVLGRCMWSQDRFADAEPPLVESNAILDRLIDRDDRSRVKNLSNLALLRWRQGRYQEAADLHREVLWLREIKGDSLGLAQTLNNLAEVEKELGDLDAAESMLERALQLKESMLGSDHQLLASTINNLAELYYRQKRYGEAEPLYRRGLAIEEATYGRNHYAITAALNNLGELLHELERPAEAVELFERARNIAIESQGPENVRVGIFENNLGEVYQQDGRLSEAESAYHSAERIFIAALGPEHPLIAYPVAHLAEIARDRGDRQGARRLMKRALRLRQAAHPAEHPLVVETLVALAELE